MLTEDEDGLTVLEGNHRAKFKDAKALQLDDVEHEQDISLVRQQSPGAHAIPGVDGLTQSNSNTAANATSSEDVRNGHRNEVDQQGAEHLVSAELVQASTFSLRSENRPFQHNPIDVEQPSSLVYDAVKDDTTEKLRKVYCILILVALTLLLVVIVVPAVVLTYGKNSAEQEQVSENPTKRLPVSPQPSTMNPTSSPSGSPTTIPMTLLPTTLFDDLVTLLSDLYMRQVDKQSLRDRTTPQGAAVLWLERNQNLVDYEDFQVIQRYALAVFYYSLGGDAWFQNDGWLSDEPECSWYSRAVQFFPVCGVDGKMEHLQFENTNNMRGTIPAEIGLLTHLKSIQLANQFGIVGSVPSEVGRLTELSIQLALGGNSLNGTIPTEVGFLSNVKYFTLGSNDFTGEIPSELGRLTNAKQFTVANNNLMGMLPSELGALTKLTSFAAAKNSLTGPIPSEIGQLSALERFLELHENELSSFIPSEIGQLTLVRNVFLQKNNLEGPIPPDLFSLSSLVDLGLSENNLNGTIPISIGKLGRARNVGLNSNRLSGEIPSEIGMIGSVGFGLSSLNLTDNALSGTVPSDIAQLTRLGRLLLSQNDLLDPLLPQGLCDYISDGLFDARIDIDCTSRSECACCSRCCEGRQCACVVNDTFHCP